MKTEKRCARCGKTKPRDQYFKNAIRADNMSIYCKPCQMEACAESRARNPQTHRKANARYRAKNPDAARARIYRAQYGITVADYEKMHAAQGGGCAICGAAAAYGGFHRRLHVDHNATTGKVRGLLCAVCNVGIGHFKHNPELLLRAIEYLK